jgi:methyltransferase (TIGR00027 family)
MQERIASRTAMRSAVLRAAHTLLHDDPKLLADPFAGPFAGCDSAEAVLSASQAHPQSQIPGFGLQLVIRSRYAEDELQAAIKRGIKQYVILGAGLDSFAFRRPDLLQKLEIFEVDLPATQNWKREQIARLGLPVLPHLHYAAVDFEQQSLSEGLEGIGFDRTKPSFFSWLGVTVYLEQHAVLATLRDMAALSAPGSGLVLSYIVSPSALPEADAALVRVQIDNNARIGEPWLSFFTPNEIEAVLHSAGFSSVTHFYRTDAYKRYMRGRSDAQLLPASFGMIVARIEKNISLEGAVDGA